MRLVHAPHRHGPDGVQVTAGADSHGEVHMTAAGGTVKGAVW